MTFFPFIIVYGIIALIGTLEVIEFSSSQTLMAVSARILIPGLRPRNLHFTSILGDSAADKMKHFEKH